MKVSINQTFEVTDEARVRLADVYDGKQSKRKATREEARTFILEHGLDWEVHLADDWNDQFAPDEDDTDDVLGGGGDPLEDLL